MKAVILEKINSDLKVGDVELTPLSYGQVLVKNRVSGLCGAQLQEIAGLKGNAKFTPHLLGHEGSGIVEEIGPGVTTVKVGDKVVMHWRKGEGIEAPFPSYIYQGTKISSGKITTLSEYSIVSENRVTTVPLDTPDELCALLGCGLTTALGTISNEAELKYGESILVLGAGGVGLNLLQGAKLVTAYPIYAVDIAEEKRSIATNCGATHFINAATEQLKDYLQPNSIDVIIDTTGNPEVIKNAMPFLASRGRFILVAQPHPTAVLSLEQSHKLFDGEGKTIKATQGGKTNPTEDIPRYIKLYKAGLLDIKKIVTHQFKLEEINEAINLLKSGTAGRILIKIY